MKILKQKAKNYRLGFTLAAVLFLLVVSLQGQISQLYAEDKTEAGSIKQWDNAKEYIADIDDTGRLFWCGSKEIALLKHKSRTISVITFYKNDLTDPKEETINININRYNYPVCSDDGRYVFFAKHSERGGFEDFLYYDRNNKSVHTIFFIR